MKSKRALLKEKNRLATIENYYKQERKHEELLASDYRVRTGIAWDLVAGKE